MHGLCSQGRKTSSGHNEVKNFDPAKIKEDMDKMHDIEHEADTKKHEMLAVLMKAFMTPIEREDIMLLSSCLDEVTDKIEDVVLRMYCNNIHDILPAAIDMARIVVDSCEEMVILLEEFKNFKRSKSIHEHIIRINTLEEDADRLFIQAMRELHEHEDDPINMIKWREIQVEGDLLLSREMHGCDRACCGCCGKSHHD